MTESATIESLWITRSRSVVNNLRSAAPPLTLLIVTDDSWNQLASVSVGFVALYLLRDNFLSINYDHAMPLTFDYFVATAQVTKLAECININCL